MRLPVIIIALLLSALQLSPQTALDPFSFKKLLKNQKGTLIDVRTFGKYTFERIGAVNINVDDSLFPARVKKLDKQTSLFICCGVGKRSQRAAAIMRMYRFKKVYELEKVWRSVSPKDCLR